MTTDSPGKRVALFRASLGMSQRQFAASLGFSPGRIGSIESGSAAPSREFLKRISERYNVSADWLLYGQGEMVEHLSGFSGRAGKQIDPPAHEVPAHGDFRFSGEDFAMIERRDLSVSAGNGLIPVEDGEKEALAFSRSWLSRNGINTDLAVLVRVKGDSMAPTIPDGALVLVHAGEIGVAREGIYAFNRDEESFIKRLVPADIDTEGNAKSLLILSDNPTYRSGAASGIKMNDIRVIGRVRCVMVTL